MAHQLLSILPPEQFWFTPFYESHCSAYRPCFHEAPWPLGENARSYPGAQGPTWTGLHSSLHISLLLTNTLIFISETLQYSFPCPRDIQYAHLYLRNPLQTALLDHAHLSSCGFLPWARMGLLLVFVTVSITVSQYCLVMTCLALGSLTDLQEDKDLTLLMTLLPVPTIESGTK